MKKLNILFTVFVIISVLFAVGCKSVPSANSVDSLDLLDQNSGFYIAVPTQADPDLLKRIIKANAQNIADKDIETLLKHIDKIYCGLNRTKKATQIQAAVDANVPVNLIPKVLTKKKGWERRSYETVVGLNYDIYATEGLELSVPSSKNVLLGRDIPEMLETYAELSLEPSEEKLLDAQVYNFLKGAESEIRFYANKPQSFLTILTGTNLNLQLLDVWGAFEQDPYQNDQYVLDLDFKFKNEKFLKTGKALLTLAFGLTAKESENNKSELIISGIQISKEALYKLLVL